MTIIIDTNIAIALRDVDHVVTERFLGLPELPMLSIVSRIELEDGVPRGPQASKQRRQLLDELLSRMQILPFGPDDADCYRRIITHCGYKRGRTIDRMIAATALFHRSTLITMNGADFSDVPGLQLEEW